MFSSNCFFSFRKLSVQRLEIFKNGPSTLVRGTVLEGTKVNVGPRNTRNISYLRSLPSPPHNTHRTRTRTAQPWQATRRLERAGMPAEPHVTAGCVPARKLDFRETHRLCHWGLGPLEPNPRARKVRFPEPAFISNSAIICDSSCPLSSAANPQVLLSYCCAGSLFRLPRRPLSFRDGGMPTGTLNTRTFLGTAVTT